MCASLQNRTVRAEQVHSPGSVVVRGEGEEEEFRGDRAHTTGIYWKLLRVLHAQEAPSHQKRII